MEQTRRETLKNLGVGTIVVGVLVFVLGLMDITGGPKSTTELLMISGVVVGLVAVGVLVYDQSQKQKG